MFLVSRGPNVLVNGIFTCPQLVNPPPANVLRKAYQRYFFVGFRLEETPGHQVFLSQDDNEISLSELNQNLYP